jgi:hypothetical protein
MTQIVQSAQSHFCDGYIMVVEKSSSFCQLPCDDLQLGSRADFASQDLASSSILWVL